MTTEACVDARIRRSLRTDPEVEAARQGWEMAVTEAELGQRDTAAMTYANRTAPRSQASFS